MKKLFLSIFLPLCLLFFSCDNSKNNQQTNGEASNTREEVLSEDAYSLLQTRCLICHTDKNLPHDELIAPPMAAVKNRYADITNSKEAFIKRMVEFTLTPTTDEAIMYGAVSRFNLMPAVVIPQDTLRKIAAFLYENDISSPDWFAEHYKEMHPEGQQGMSLAIVDKIQQIDKLVQQKIAGQSGLSIDLQTHESLQKVTAKVENTGEQENLTQYRQLAQSLFDMLPTSESNEAAKVYLEALQQKTELMQKANMKEEAEFILLHIRKQLQNLDEHFEVED